MCVSECDSQNGGNMGGNGNSMFFGGARWVVRPPRTLQNDYAQDPTVVLGGGAVSDERGTPVDRALGGASRARIRGVE